MRTIRLTENDLHNIIKESVRRIINEVQVNGQSLHGNNAQDWQTMQNIRRQQFFNSNGQNNKAKNAWFRNADNRRDLQYQERQQQAKQNTYQPQLVSRRMNNGQVMIFDPNRNQPVTNMTFDGAEPQMVQGNNSITAWKDNTNYEVYPNGQVQRINRF